MGYEKVGLWGISKGAELALLAGILLPGLVNAVISVAPMSTVCQGFAKEKGISFVPLVKNPNPDAVIKVEKITGPILLISSKMDNMWPSELAAEKIMKRLKEHDFPYLYQHLSYEYGSHLFVPMELRSTKFFKGDRGKNKENGRKARMQNLPKNMI